MAIKDRTNKAAPQPERRSTTAKRASSASNTPATARSTTATSSATRTVSDDERNRMIAEAAYYRSERRGYEPGHELEDWLAAEAEVREKLKQ